MRIFHVINHTGRLNGNVHAAVDLACAQASLGHQVAMCSSGGDFDRELTASGVAIYVVDQKRSPAALAGAAWRMLRNVRRFRADVVHAHMVASALVASVACRLTRRPLITTVHNAFDKSAVLMRAGNRVIAVSEAVRTAMAERGVPPDKLRTVLNGTIGSARLAAPAPPSERLAHPAVLFVGGLHPRKGVGDLLSAFDIVHRCVPSARLYLVGEGPSLGAYQAQAASLSCGGAVSFCGAKDDPRGYMRGADIFVLPSLADPAPLVLPEAREAGCAMIATTVDGIPELLDHGRAGILVPPASPAKLAEALMPLVTDPQVLARWKAAAQQGLERFSVERVAQETVAIYEECLAPKRRRATGDGVRQASGNAAQADAGVGSSAFQASPTGLRTRS